MLVLLNYIICLQFKYSKAFSFPNGEPLLFRFALLNIGNMCSFGVLSNNLHVQKRNPVQLNPHFVPCNKENQLNIYLRCF